MRGGTESGGLAAVTISLSLRLRHCGVTRTGGPSHPCSGGNTQQDNTTTSAELSVLQVLSAHIKKSRKMDSDQINMTLMKPIIKRLRYLRVLGAITSQETGISVLYFVFLNARIISTNSILLLHRIGHCKISCENFGLADLNIRCFPTLSPGIEIPVRAIVEVVSVEDEYLLPGRDLVYGGDAGDGAEPRVQELSELAVRNKTAVSGFI